MCNACDSHLGSVATEPKVRVTRGGNNPTRTYRFLLESPYDMKLLESLVTGQVALIDVNDGKITKIGFPNLIRSVSMSPNEENFRVTTMKKPFSYYVPLARFGSQEGVWNLEGKSLYTLNDRNLQDTEPQRAAAAAGAGAGGQRAGRGGRGGRGQGQGPGQGQQPTPATTPTPGPTQPPTDPIPDPNADPTAPAAPPVDPNAKRDIGWRPDGVGLSYLQLEAPKADATAARKDRVMQWLPPFGQDDCKLVYEDAKSHRQRPVFREWQDAVPHANGGRTTTNQRHRFGRSEDDQGDQPIRRSGRQCTRWPRSRYAG